MKDQTQGPQRACRLKLDLQGDTRQDVTDALRNIAFDLERGEMTSGVSGGYSSGYTYAYNESDRPTHVCAYKPEEIEARAREIVDMLTPLSAVIDGQAQQDADKADQVSELVHAMFRSGNDVSVSRITITREQYEAASQQLGGK